MSLSRAMQTLLPAETCVEALVVAGGNVALAAERLFGNDPNSSAYLMASIAQDPLALDSLNNQLRTLTTLKTFDTLNTALVLMPAVIQDMEPADFAKMFNELIKRMGELTAPLSAARSNDPQDALQRLMATLPPSARRALITLISTDSSSEDLPPLPPHLEAIEPEDESLSKLSGGFEGHPPFIPDLGDGGDVTHSASRIREGAASLESSDTPPTPRDGEAA